MAGCPLLPPRAPSPRPRHGLSFVILVAALLSACAEPPSREMNQAQGAIDAARAAGAEEYAADELKSAVDALAQADEAVKANDYRLALAHALDSRESAQNAAKAAVDGRARARGDAERALAESAAVLERAERRLKDPAVVRLPRRTLTATEALLAQARTLLQEARTALEAEEYQRVSRAAEAAAKHSTEALEGITAAERPPTRGRRR